MVLDIRLAEASDWERYACLDTHISQETFLRKVEAQECIVALTGNRVCGVLRYGMFWDEIPFIYHLYVAEDMRRKKVGSQLLCALMIHAGLRGCELIMTSTQADEEAQHFYRSFGFKDAGGFLIPIPGHEQPLELVMVKPLAFA